MQLFVYLIMNFARKMSTKLQEKKCHICGDTSQTHFNYGGVCCEACKSFFRRTAQNKKQYICVDGNNCPISISTRGNCIACRLAKCYRIGMRSDLLFLRKNKEISNMNSSFEQSEQIHYPLPEIPNAGKIFPNKSPSLALGTADRQCINQVNNSMNFFVNEFKLKLELAATDDNKLNHIAIYIRRMIQYLKTIPIFGSIKTADQIIMLKEILVYFVPLRFAFQYDRQSDCYILLKNENSTSAIQLKRGCYLEHCPDTEGIYENMNIILRLNRELEGDEMLRNLLTATFIALPLSKVIGVEYIRYFYFMNCYLLRRYLEDKLKDEEQANAKFARLMNLTYNGGITASKNYNRWIQQYAWDQIEETIRELAETELAVLH